MEFFFGSRLRGDRIHKATKGTIRVLKISHLRAGNCSNSTEKEKATSDDKYIDNQNITGIRSEHLRSILCSLVVPVMLWSSIYLSTDVVFSFSLDRIRLK